MFFSFFFFFREYPRSTISSPLPPFVLHPCDVTFCFSRGYRLSLHLLSITHFLFSTHVCSQLSHLLNLTCPVIERPDLESFLSAFLKFQVNLIQFPQSVAWLFPPRLNGKLQNRGPNIQRRSRAGEWLANRQVDGKWAVYITKVTCYANISS